MHIESHQYLDLVALFAPITKWNAQIVRPDNTTEVVRRAFKVAPSRETWRGTYRSARKYCSYALR